MHLRRGFDFTLHAERLCRDICTRVEDLAHIDMDLIAVSFAQTRKSSTYGAYASLTPMRFEGGSSVMQRRGRQWQIQRMRRRDGREILYILSFYLPRFQNLVFRDKLETVIHELWHCSPKFNGDLRRFPGRCFAHGSSQARYDAIVKDLADCYLLTDPSGLECEFLRWDFTELESRHGGVFGRKIPRPKLIPCSRAS